MNKFGKLLTRIEKFSVDAHFEYRLAKFAAETSSLMAESEKFDIKDEELFNQFESFMSGYKELMDTFKMDSEHLDPDNLEDAGELVTTLHDRLKRIISNPYLNMNESEGWEEEFDPGDFTQFLIKVAQDADDKLKQIAGEDFEISDLKAAQLASEFNNNRNIDKGDQNITWTGDKIQDAIKARKNRAEKLAFEKKINSPIYQEYINKRKLAYRNYVDNMDPEKKQVYLDNARKRQSKFQAKLDAKRIEIISKIKKETNEYRIHKLEEELAEVDKLIAARESKRTYVRKEQAKQVKEIKESGTLKGLVVSFSQRLASYKKDAAKAIKSKAYKDPYFSSLKAESQSAKDKFDADPSIANKAALEAVIRKEVAAVEDYLNNNPIVNKINTDFVVLYAFRDQLNDDLVKSGWLDMSQIPEEVKPILAMIAKQTDDLITTYGNSYPGPFKIIKDISNLIKSKI